MEYRHPLSLGRYHLLEMVYPMNHLIALMPFGMLFDTLDFILVIIVAVVVDI